MWLFRKSVADRPTLWMRLQRQVDLTQLIFIGISFATIFVYKFRIQEFFDIPGLTILDLSSSADVITSGILLEKLPGFFIQNYLGLILFAVTVLWYHLYKSAVQNELLISSRLFMAMDPPSADDVERLVGAKYSTVLAFSLTIAYLVMALVSDIIQMYCFLMLLLSMQDMIGNSLVKRGLRRLFFFEEYLPSPDDPEGQIVIRRREVARRYWLDAPHLERIGLMMVITALALMLSLGEPVLGLRIPEFVPYAIVVGVILGNEVVINRWRDARDQALFEIQRDADEAGID